MSDVSAVAATFTRFASGYDTLRRQLIPCFDDFYGSVLDLVRDRPDPAPLGVLDLGAGTGLLSAMILDGVPVARLTLLDASSTMLDKARDRFGDDDRVSFITGDMITAGLLGPYDLVVSALAIHHLTHDEKRALFVRVRALLSPGGQFINAEQVLGATPAAESRQNREWLEAVRKAGLSEAEIENARERMALDRCATVADQLAWMSDAGLVDVDCAFKAGRFAVLAGAAST